jgi:hypothetical protein
MDKRIYLIQKDGFATAIGAKVVIYFQVSIGDIRLHYQIFLKLIYQITRYHAPEGNKISRAKRTYNSK